MIGGFEGFGKNPKLTIGIEKIDNGYVVNLNEPSIYDSPAIAQGEPEPNMDETLDAMIDGMVTFMKFVTDKTTGEDWKADDDREKVRRAIRTMFPSLSCPPPSFVISRPRSEHKVFQSKAEIVKYLEENL